MAKFRAQQAQHDAVRAGADGQLGTADDDNAIYFFDEDGNMYAQPHQQQQRWRRRRGFICRRSRWC